MNGPTVFQLRLKEASDASPFSHVQLHVLRSSGESRLDDLAYNHLNQHKYRVVGSKSVYNIYVFWRGLPNVVFKEATAGEAAALLSEKEILDWHDLD